MKDVDEQFVQMVCEENIAALFNRESGKPE
jgi:hypothetical protein